MRKIAANMVFPVSGFPIKNGIIILSDYGEIVEVLSGGETLNEIENLEFYNGILVPGFVNSHCHIELSHLKQKITAGIGLSEFIKLVPNIRNNYRDFAEKEAEKALKYMWSRGIQVVGDIVNTSDSFSAKKNAPVTCVNFIEVFNKKNIPVSQLFHEGKQLKTLFEEYQQTYFSPHSFYGSSPELISTLLEDENPEAILSLHFKESCFEADVNYREQLTHILECVKVKKLLLVHNLNINQSDIDWITIETTKKCSDVFWILCPNSNLYIEQRLPPVSELANSTIPVCLGTDSLASNTQLSVLEEIKTIGHYFPEIPFETVLQWATLNGAKALGVDKQFGSFERNKKPGVLLISGFDFKNQKLFSEAEVSRLV